MAEKLAKRLKLGVSPKKTKGIDLSDIARSFWKWLWCTGARERAVADAAEKLQTSMRVTAKSRYNASVRLQSQNRFSFFTATLLSLGLIFIPLMQNAGVVLAFADRVLNMIQIFLAVSVLVYSVVIATARFDTRAEKLTDCGNRLKELIRSIDKDRQTPALITAVTLAEYQRRYSDVVTDSENHGRSDYHLATLEMRNDYFITGIPYAKAYLYAHLSNLVAYAVPALLLALECVFIADMVGLTAIVSPHLRATAAVVPLP